MLDENMAHLFDRTPVWLGDIPKLKKMDRIVSTKWIKDWIKANWKNARLRHFFDKEGKLTFLFLIF